jgi:hypothetical protein
MVKKSKKSSTHEPIPAKPALIDQRKRVFGIYLEKGGRLGLKCLLLSYFRASDYTTGTRE